jgi:flagellar hook-associated protein 3 FlgL
MSMRVTTLMSTRATLRDLNDGFARLNRLQGQLSSGKQITRPSDDPSISSSATSTTAPAGSTPATRRSARCPT